MKTIYKDWKVYAHIDTRGFQNNRLWFAVISDYEDTDLKFGSCDFEEALHMLFPYPEGAIVVVEESSDSIAIDLIGYTEIFN